jgi:hypothetical protein
MQEEESKLCRICLDRKSDTVFIPCGHVCVCQTCSKSPLLKLCPIDRQPIRHKQKIYL